MNNPRGSAQAYTGSTFPHIDGIRALAVLPVMLFHILATLCPGGFVGVDVFFVISGYLITGGILRDLGNGRFTIRNFYYRRIRHIMPAYFVLIAGVFAAGCTFYYAAPLILLGDAVTAGTLFVANFHFWILDNDYFAPHGHPAALLHLWSLSVEEQFYLFIPLLCAVIWRFGRRLVAPALALLAALSLSAAICAVMIDKQGDAFYFLHYRAWELLTGSLLATLPAVRNAARTSPLSSSISAEVQACTESRGIHAPLKIRHALLASVGLLLVLISYAAISSKTPFPGAAALPAVVGTALLIRYGQNGWVSGLLSCRALVLTGKISYSLYLWHWPVTVFWRYAVYDQLCFSDYVGMFLVSLLLGYLSWRFVELPVRTSSAWTMRRSFLFATAGMTCLAALGTACVYCKGWPTLLHPKANEVACMPPPRDPLLLVGAIKALLPIGSATGYDFKAAREHESRKLLSMQSYAIGLDGSFNIGAPGQPDVFLLGDSHAGSLRCGLDTLLRARGIAAYAISCSGTDLFDARLHNSEAALKKLSDLPQVRHVILAEMWQRSKDPEEQDRPPDSRFAQLEAFSARVKSMGKTLLIATDVPHYRYVLNDIEARTKIVAPRQTEIVLESRQQADIEYDRAQGEINAKLEDVCKKTGAVLIPLHLAFKEDDHYISIEAKGGQTIPLYRDTDHLSNAGSLRGGIHHAVPLPENRRERSTSGQGEGNSTRCLAKITGTRRVERARAASQGKCGATTQEKTNDPRIAQGSRVGHRAGQERGVEPACLPGPSAPGPTKCSSSIAVAMIQPSRLRRSGEHKSSNSNSMGSFPRKRIGRLPTCRSGTNGS